MKTEDKKEVLMEKANEIRSTTETQGFIYLSEKLAKLREKHDLKLATDWSDFKYRLGVLKGLSLLEEVADITLQQADRVRRGKRH